MGEKRIRPHAQGGHVMSEPAKIRLIEIGYRVLVLALLVLWVAVP